MESQEQVEVASLNLPINAETPLVQPNQENQIVLEEKIEEKLLPLDLLDELKNGTGTHPERKVTSDIPDIQLEEELLKYSNKEKPNLDNSPSSTTDHESTPKNISESYPANQKNNILSEVKKINNSLNIPNNTLNLKKIFLSYDPYTLVMHIKSHPGSISSQFIVPFFDIDEVNNIFCKIFPYLLDIMCSYYGNYFITKFFLKLNTNQRLLVLNFMSINGNFVNICTNKSGTHAIQGLMDAISTKNEELIFFNLINQNLFLFFTNENSYHVIQKIMIDYQEKDRMFLNYFVLENFTQIACNQYGSECIIKFLIFNTNLDIKLKLMKLLDENFIILAKNKYGSNVLIFIMDKIDLKFTCQIYIKIANNFCYLMNLKDFNVHLNEKCLYYIIKVFPGYLVKLTWDVFKNFNTNLLNNESYVSIIISLLQHSLQEQKKYFKVHNLPFIKDDKIYQKISKYIE